MISKPQKLLLSLLFILVLSSFSIDTARSEERKEKAVKTGTVIGKILIKDEGPLAFGQVMFYNAATGPPPVPDKYERIPDISKNINAEGTFTVELPEGQYYLGAIRRLSGERFGPPKVGDHIFRSLDDQGRPKEYLIEHGKHYDVGTFSGAIPMRAEDFVKSNITTAIKGIIMDMNGDPFKGAVVVAFIKPTVGGKPLFISSSSDKDGKYTLPLTAGTYYLRVRNSFAAGPPQPGQIVGYYGDGRPAPVSLEEGKILKGINFSVIKFPGRGPLSNPPSKEQ
jgi:hypothetical protein